MSHVDLSTRWPWITAFARSKQKLVEGGHPALHGLRDCWLLLHVRALLVLWDTPAGQVQYWSHAEINSKRSMKQWHSWRTAKPDKKPDFTYKCLFQFMMPYLRLQRSCLKAFVHRMFMQKTVGSIEFFAKCIQCNLLSLYQYHLLN